MYILIIIVVMVKENECMYNILIIIVVMVKVASTGRCIMYTLPHITQIWTPTLSPLSTKGLGHPGLVSGFTLPGNEKPLTSDHAGMLVLE